MAISISNVKSIVGGALETIRQNPIATVGAVAGSTALVGGGLVVAKAVSKRKKSSSKKKKKTTKKRKSSTRKKTKKSKRRVRKTPHTAGKGKDRSTRRIRQTKNGQPYIILKSGKARFIKKSSARASRKRKGGRY